MVLATVAFILRKGQFQWEILKKASPFGLGFRKAFGMAPPRIAQRKCYGYDTDPGGELVINPDEAAVVRWIFVRYLGGDSLGKIVAGLEEKGIPSPTGKLKWNREALNRLLSNEKYTGRVLLQKTISVGGTKMKNDGFMDRYLYFDSHEAIIPDETFRTVQQEKMGRTIHPGKEHLLQILYLIIWNCNAPILSK